MMILLLVAGAVFMLAGLASILVGVPVKEFSFGNTLILSGVVGACTGAILLGLSAVLRELRALGDGLAADEAASGAQVKVRPVFPPQPAPVPMAEVGGQLFPGDRPEPELAPQRPPAAEPAGQPLPWQDEASMRDRPRPRPAPPLEITAPPPPPAPPPAAPPPPPAPPSPLVEAETAEEATSRKRRNLLFSTTSRKERERAAARAAAGADDESGTAPAGEESAAAPAAAAPRTFDEAWPESGRLRGDLGARPNRPASAAEAPGETPAAPERSAMPEPEPAPRRDDRPQVTVLKSGSVDGMEYSLYSDGSIEAQMPEGMMRFASIDELRAHLDQRS